MSFMALGALLRPGLCFVLRPPVPAPFASVGVCLRLRRPASTFTGRAAGLIVAALLRTATGVRLRLRFRWLRLRFRPLPLRLRSLLFAATLLATAAALLFAAAPIVRAFVAAPLFGAFGALLGMAAPLPMGFRVSAGDRRAGDRDAGQRKRTADRDRGAGQRRLTAARDRAALYASVSQAARHVPACLRVPRRARGRS
jgi:hypothetical protein